MLFNVIMVEPPQHFYKKGKMIQADPFFSLLRMMPRATRETVRSHLSDARTLKMEPTVSRYVRNKLMFFINYPLSYICFHSRKLTKIHGILIILSTIQIESLMSALTILHFTKSVQRFWLLHMLMNLSVLIYQG